MIDPGTKLILRMLGKELAEEIKAREQGHCVRVDHLTSQAAEFLCAEVTEHIGSSRCFVLTGKQKEELSSTELNTERAIELRNRKPQAFVLLVPSGLTDSTASSLRNAFAVFDLDQYWHDSQTKLTQGLADELREFVPRALRLSRLPGVSEEDRATYCAAIACSDTKEKTAAMECYRVGLIPDSEANLSRLQDNVRAAREIARPIKSYSSLSDRLDAVGVQPGSQRRTLETLLDRFQLSDWRSWMGAISQEVKPELYFSNWDLISRSRSQLRRLVFTPWLDAHGNVQNWSKLRQSEAGTQPFAIVGPKSDIQVRWESDPKSPEGLDKWRIEMIPSQDFYATSETPDVSLPTKKVKGSLKRTSIKLSAIDWPEDTSSIVVQVRLSALSETGAELANELDEPFVAISDEIQLRPADEEQGLDVESSKSAKSSRDLPLAKLRVAVDQDSPDLTETSFQWSGTRENVFNLTVGSGNKIRISLSPVLKQIESRSLDMPENLGVWEVDAVAGDTLLTENLRDHRVSVSSEAGNRFLVARQDFFRQLKEHGPRRWLATVEWTPNLDHAADSYVESYLAWIGAEDRTERQLALSIDTGLVGLRCDGRTIAASLTSPLNPLRIAWFRKYRESIGGMIKAMEMSLTTVSERKESIDLNTMELIDPSGCPMLTTAIDGNTRLTTGCLDFLWTAALPVDWPDPARALSLVAEVLGISSQDQGMSASLISNCAGHIRNYLQLHGHARKVRVVTDNAGDGAFVSQVLCDSVRELSIDEGEQVEQEIEEGVESIELLAHFRRPLPSSMPGIVPLRQSLEQRGGKHATSVFQPLLETSIRDSGSLTKIPGGGSHLTLLMDITTVQVMTEDVPERRGTAALGGLLCPFRLLPGGPPWRYCVSEASEDDSLTKMLVKHQQSLASLLGSSNGSQQGLPVLTVAIAGDAARLAAIHDHSDWVVTLDRFIEPAWIESHAGMRYLLDYSPDITDGLTRTLFVTTGHREEAEQVVGETLNELGFNSSKGAVTCVLHRLQQVSGRLALRALGSGSTQREAAALAITIEKMHLDGHLHESIIVPVDSHIEMFTPYRRQGRPEKGRRCDLLLVRVTGEHQLDFQLVEVKGRTHRPSPDVFAAIQDQLDSTDRLVKSLWVNPNRYDRPIQLYRLRQILEYHLRRAYGFGTVTNLNPWHSVLERLARGLVDVRTQMKGFVVCTSAMPEIFRRGNLEIEVIGDIALDSSEAVSLYPSIDKAFNPTRTSGSASDGAIRIEDTAATESVAEHGSVSTGDVLSDSSEPIETSNDEPLDDQLSAGRPDSPTDSSPKTTHSPIADFLDDVFQKDEGEDSTSGTAESGNLFEELDFVSDRPTADSENRTIDSDRELPAKEDAISDDVEPSSSNQEISIILGDGPSGPAFWRPAVSGSPHLFVIGIPGQGKSVTTTRILCELTKQHVPALVLDFHGEFADMEGPYNRLARPAILNAADGLPFSILEPKHGKGPRAKESIWELAEICQYVCGLGDIQRDSVYQAFENAYESVEPGETPLLSSVSDFIDDEEVDGNVKNVKARCRPLFEFGLFANSPSEGIYEQFTKGAVVDLHELRSETLQLAAGAFTLRKLYRAMFTWGTADRIRLAIVLDEAHRLAKDVTLPKIMKEGRKFGIAVVVASQDVRDFHEQVLSNAGTKVIFRVNYPDSRKVSGFVRAGSGDTLSQQIERLPVAEAIIQTPEMSLAEQIRMRRVND